MARVALIGLSSTAIGFSSPAQVRRPARELLIEEVAAVPLPDDVGVLGGAFASDGSVILWGETALWTHATGQPRVTSICRNLAFAPRYAAESEVLGHLEAFDSASHRVLRIRPQDRCEPRLTWRTSGRTSMVGRAAGSWTEVLVASGSRLIVRGPGRVRLDSIITIPFESPVRFGTAGDYMTSSAKDGLLMTEIAFPYRTFHLSPRGDFTLALDPASQLSAPDRATILAGWESLRVIPIDDAFLQVLADPRSDQRRVLVLDAEGQLVRSTLLDVAIGVLDADHRSKLLIALRNVGRSELVYYRWHWRS